MSQNQFSNSKASEKAIAIPYGWITFGMIGIFILMAGALIITSPAGPTVRGLVNWMFALDSVQSTTWYVTRSAGFMAYLLLWLSTVWGLVIPSKLFDRFLHRSFTFDFHQTISLLALGFLGLHVFILLADQYLPYSLAQILVPFLSPYRPFWVGIGVIAFYISILVTITFYLRQKIGMKTFRLIHYTSLVGYLGATFHGFFAGTDSSLPVAMLMYFGTFLIVAFLTTYWLLMAWMGKRPKTAAARVR